MVVRAMGSVDPPELSLDFRPVSIFKETVVNDDKAAAEKQDKSWFFAPKTIDELIGEVSAMDGDVQEKLLKLDGYVRRLDDEMRKIDAFKRELPLCMLLINDAIKTVKEESIKYRKSANAEPVLEEFIPIKRTPDVDDEKNMVDDTKNENNDCRDKMSWMSSVQLWNSDITPSPRTDFQLNLGQNPKPDTKKRTIEEHNQDGFFMSCKSQGLATAFAPFKGCSVFPMTMTSKENGYELSGVPKLSLNTPALGTKKPREDLDTVSSNFDSKISVGRAVPCSLPNVQSNMRVISQQQQSNSRKQRRCWSPELHRRFVDALQKLGGCQAATPKQIRELMQVDGLTNDEVKSHLQKYRLHTRRLPNATSTSGNQSVMVLGGLWMSQDHNGESSKQSTSQSSSPQCPLQLGGTSRGTSTTGGNSMEDDEDEKSESHSWKSHVLTS